ncbi:hypothetical protein AYK24_08830 [Thermoplasmatales archaeon SG8-52-4]|nr:MAG: hypothetical protein AYK24_08830 [Thermoplasmatales archaeon SG8-52-4]
MKKSLSLLFIFTLLFISFPICKANFNVFPRELSITMNNELIKGNTSKRVLIANNIDENINVSWYIDNPTLDIIRENRTIIPDLNWISIEPEWQEIPPDGNAYFYIYLNIPKIPQNFDQHWEVWPTFKQDETQFINLEHTVRLYIDTPANIESDNEGFIFDFYIIILVIIFIIIIFVILLFIFKKRNHKK